MRSSLGQVKVGGPTHVIHLQVQVQVLRRCRCGGSGGVRGAVQIIQDGATAPTPAHWRPRVIIQAAISTRRVWRGGQVVDGGEAHRSQLLLVHLQEVREVQVVQIVLISVLDQVQHKLTALTRAQLAGTFPTHPQYLK